MHKPASEHALAVIKAGLNAVPVVGGSIASLIGDYIPTATQRNVQETLESLRRRIEFLGNRIDVEVINREEFAEVFKSAYLVIVRTHQSAKLRAAVLLVSNVLLREGDPEKLSYTEIDHYVRCLDLLSVGGIQTLAHAVRLAEEREPNVLADRSVRINFEDLQACQPAIAPSLLMGVEFHPELTP